MRALPTVVVAEDHVFPPRHRQGDAAAVAVFRNVRDAHQADGAGRGVRDVAPVDQQPAPCDATQADQGLDQLGLAVALYARDAVDLAGPDGERDITDGRAGPPP